MGEMREEKDALHVWSFWIRFEKGCHSEGQLRAAVFKFHFIAKRVGDVVQSSSSFHVLFTSHRSRAFISVDCAVLGARATEHGIMCTFERGTKVLERKGRVKSFRPSYYTRGRRARCTSFVRSTDRGFTFQRIGPCFCISMFRCPRGIRIQC